MRKFKNNGFVKICVVVLFLVVVISCTHNRCIEAESNFVNKNFANNLSVRNISSSASADDPDYWAYFTSDTLDRDLSIWEHPYINPDGPLNRYYGVAGTMGGLGVFGGIGDNPWNATSVFDMMPSYFKVDDLVSEFAGNRSANGPMIMDNKITQAFFSAVSQDLFPGGYLHVLGSGGPYNYANIYGVAGTNSGVKFKRNNDGDFIDEEGNVHRFTQVNTYEGPKDLHLYEFYSEERAKNMLDNDTTFAVHGHIEKLNESDVFSFHTESERWVSILVIADHPNDFYRLSIIDKDGKERMIAGKTQSNLSSFIVAKIPADMQIQFKVKRVTPAYNYKIDSAAKFNSFWNPFIYSKKFEGSYRVFISESSENSNSLVVKQPRYHVKYKAKEMFYKFSKPMKLSCFEEMDKLFSAVASNIL